MTLNFPNDSRSYDARRDLVRFWGHDRAMEVAFFIEAAALRKLSPQSGKDEAACLAAFDAARAHIHEVARKAFSQRRRNDYTLAASDF